ncbi:MAG: peptidylprolyl isomerase [Saprospiraceae bacterium]
MALIGTIRKHGWVLILLMALALAGFILMDVMSNSQRYSASDVNTLGKVGDTEIKRSEFDTYEKLVYSDQQRENAYQIRDQAWTYFTEKAIIEQEVEPLGLGVGKEELLDLQFGLNLSPVISERFKNDAGQIDRAQLSSIKNAIEQNQFTEPRARAYWSVQEKEIIKSRLQEKLNNAVIKGLYTPKWQAEMAFKENNERRDICAVRITYDKVKDEEATLTDSDYKAFLELNPRLYDQDEESRVISFVAFDVMPTSLDSANTYESATKLIEGLRNAKNDSIHVLANGGSYTNAFMGKDKFPAVFADSIMSGQLGSVVGPLLDEGEWSIIKIIDRKVLPDSVRARHILVREATPENEARADSLMALLKSGKERFDSLAIKASQDGGSGQKGGDLGWLANGATVPEFNNLCFVTGEQGKLYKVATQFGWHIIEITGKKFIKNEPSARVAGLRRRIEPSKTTQQVVKDKAVALVQQSKNITELGDLAGKQNLQLQNTAAVKINDHNLGTVLGSGEDVRDIIRWAFEENTKTGDVSKEIFALGDTKGGYFDSKYVVAAIKNIIPKGKATVATLKSLDEATLRVKNLKKAEVIKLKALGATDLPAFAAQWNGKVDTLRGSNFLQTNGEPRVIGAAFALETGKISAPIVGNGGVHLIQPITDKTQPQVPADITMFRRQMSSQAIGAMRMGLIKSLVRQYEVEDNRFRFW